MIFLKQYTSIPKSLSFFCDISLRRTMIHHLSQIPSMKPYITYMYTYSLVYIRFSHRQKLSFKQKLSSLGCNFSHGKISRKVLKVQTAVVPPILLSIIQSFLVGIFIFLVNYVEKTMQIMLCGSYTNTKIEVI